MMKWCLGVVLAVCARALADAAVRTCEPIKVAMCRDIGYNQTGMPNLARHTLQADADVTLQTFSPLVQYGCSEQLHLFLCAVYVPMCTDKVALPIGPCRSLCEAVHARCFPVLSGFGFQWPAELDCELFPAENNHEHMCMEGPGERAAGAGAAAGEAACRRLRRAPAWLWLRGAGRCAQYCDAEVLWEAGERRAAEVWLATWAALSFACTLAAAGAALACGAGAGAGVGAGGAGERALVLVALCRCAAAAGWGVRAAAGRAAAGCAQDPASTRMLLAHDGLANPNCAVVFLLLYYFGLAASVWWVVVAGAWRAAVLRPTTLPGAPRHDRHSSLLQLAAWGVPAALAAAVLVTRDVDADELTGTCFVGNQSSKSLLALVIVPEAICLLLGGVFLASGLRAVLRRAPPPPPPALLAPAPAPAPRPDQSVLRLGAFAALYAAPSACILATYVYEYLWRDAWLAAPGAQGSGPQPAFWVFLFRIFASQILGVMVAVWIGTPRLKALWRRAVGPRKPVKPPPAPLALPAHCYAHAHTLPRHTHKYSTYRPPSHHYSYRKPRHYHYSAGETIL
ncbi:hypothetical protein JYU34_001741 [Plutella xylostella]|uniref:Frizzled-4 n=1 Tax=Plutella xylostella TaxID=51655 RepID=A0ABQ7R4R9_PLUXY|nr:hypothetical protein JYU34_001741 [Plutella xylostella]